MPTALVKIPAEILMNLDESLTVPKAFRRLA